MLFLFHFIFNFRWYYDQHNRQLRSIRMSLEDIRREVQEAKDAQQSALALIVGLKAKIDELIHNATDLAQLQSELTALSQELSDSTDALVAGVAANSPDPAEEPVDEEEPVDGGGEPVDETEDEVEETGVSDDEVDANGSEEPTP